VWDIPNVAWRYKGRTGCECACVGMATGKGRVVYRESQRLSNGLVFLS
jgi:hypothetical protein